MQAFTALNRQGGLHFKSMLHFENIFFDEQGFVKLQEMSHVFFDQYKLKPTDLIFMPPEALSHGKLSERGDVWTLGIILLICMSLEFDFEAGKVTLESMLNNFNKVKGKSLIQLVKESVQASMVNDSSGLSAGSYPDNKGDKGFESGASNADESEDSDEPSNESTKREREHWVDFYITNNDYDFANLVNGSFADFSNFSELFLDFLQECLVMDVTERQSAISLLSHPVFKSFNKNQSEVCRQRHIRSSPIVSFEKQYLKKMVLGAHQPIGKKQLFEIAKLKIRSNNPGLQFAQFLQRQIDQFENAGKQEDKTAKLAEAGTKAANVIQMPRFIRANNKSGGNFLRLKGKPAQMGQSQGSQLSRQAPTQNLAQKRQIVQIYNNLLVSKPSSEGAQASEMNSSTFIVLKPDVDKNILQMTVKEDNSVFNSMTSVGSTEDAKSSNAGKGPKSKFGSYLGDADAQDEEPEQMVSD